MEKAKVALTFALYQGDALVRRETVAQDIVKVGKDPRSHLRVEEVPELKQAGVIEEGMLPKVDSAIAAIESGVEKVQFIDGRIPHSLLLEIFTDAGVGTEVVK